MTKNTKTTKTAKNVVRFEDAATIVVKSKDHTFRGKRAKALDAILRCKTVASARASLAKLEQAGYFPWAMATAVEQKLVTVTPARA